MLGNYVDLKPKQKRRIVANKTIVGAGRRIIGGIGKKKGDV
jgi:hypothetical protein